jgi:hypothetical protein
MFEPFIQYCLSSTQYSWPLQQFGPSLGVYFVEIPIHVMGMTQSWILPTRFARRSRIKTMRMCGVRSQETASGLFFYKT